MAQKNLVRLGTAERRRMIDTTHPKLPVTEQCALLGAAALELLSPATARVGRKPPADAGDRDRPQLFEPPGELVWEPVMG